MDNSSRQLRMPFVFDSDEKSDTGLYSGREIGTFKDSLRAPIFRWFKYPAGYSYKFVYESFDIFEIVPEDWVYDPFSGTGTTLICAKQRGVHGYGVEAHSFVHWVASVKLYWDFDHDELARTARQIIQTLHKHLDTNRKNSSPDGIYPDLIYKCYHPDDLNILHRIRLFIEEKTERPHLQNLLKLALTDTLRGAAVAGTGWPYISPKADPASSDPKGALTVFVHTLMQMINDLRTVANLETNYPIINQLGDSRQRQSLEDGRVKLAITSPPYLNNYDYADRTRLETYFWGITRSWAEITKQFRDKLMVAATTQIRRSQHDVETTLSEEIRAIDKSVYQQIQTSVLELAQRRLQKGGKKDYDLMTALYFNDMFLVLKETHRLLIKGGHFCLVLGDSAPYGVHIPTDDIIGALALGLGFSDYTYHKLRDRGTKWKDNPQRHKVPLREGVVILTK